MASRLDNQLQAAEKRTRLAELRYRERVLKASYDAISENHRKGRQQPAIEMIGEDAHLRPWDRLKAIARGRDLYRNSSAVRGMFNQLLLNILGTHPKLMLHSGDEKWDATASRWFNSDFARNCDGRGERHLADLNASALLATWLCGDVLMLFDRTGIIPGADGRLVFFEADQMPSIDDGDWKAHKDVAATALGVPADELLQSDGVIYSKWGRTLGYVVVSEYGRPVVKLEEATILPATEATLLYSCWRPNQRRGSADILPIANDMTDLHEIRQALLARMKAQSYLALKVKKRDSDMVSIGRTDSSDKGSSVTVDDPTKSGHRNYANYEKLSRGAIEYLEPDEDVETLSLPGDIPDAEALASMVSVSAGFALGLTRLFAVGKADASYSASRAEGNLAEAHFAVAQKRTERYLLDWQASRAIAWAIDAGKLPAGPAGWESVLDWRGWPALKPLDPNQEANALRTRLAIGATDWSEILGPDWREKLTALGEQIQAGRTAGFFAEPFQPKPTTGANTP